ncbi:mobile mystery protein B [Plebeiibacterium sediminum]|uniref:Mobile mystery protein B n=1 Tax=Plebeiibacterium sediminum TaxID=2992112 RepID=A0AAE3M699_9BACT|nr:mobile mystery protein B [Plebeiobacterium sediminum]MCW3787964.1 mobile mystery protein B [Plebeiobacterium sediminum]
MIDTGNPPGATPLSEDELEGLKIKTIKTRGELDRWEQQNIGEAMEWLDKRKNKSEILNEDFVMKLHTQMFHKVWTWAGTFRKTNKNIGVDKFKIAIDLRHLLDDVKFWIENKTFNSDGIAVRLHHRIVAIHCFPNGNGRHARLIADTLLTDVFGLEPFTWGNGDLTSKGDVRKKYIEALRAADRHDYEPLEKFVRS